MNLNLLTYFLPVNPPDSNRIFSQIFNAIRRLTYDIDRHLSGTSPATTRLVGLTHIPTLLPEGALIYVEEGEATTMTDKGYNAVYSGGTVAKAISAIARPGITLIPGQPYWLQLGDGQITHTPNTSFRLQLLGFAVSTSDLHFIYSPPTS